MEDHGTVTVAKPKTTKEVRKDNRPERQPKYNIVLWDDDDHSYEYVVLMMRQLFSHSYSQGFEIARMVDDNGKAICMTTTREHAELKRDQIHSFGKDLLIGRCSGSMSATIEPAPGE